MVKEKPENPKPEKTEEKAAKSGEKQKRPKPKEMEGDVLEFEIPKGVNRYNFLHIPKKSIDFLPFQVGEKLRGKIDPDAKTLIIRKA